jgi:hypothetical protein
MLKNLKENNYWVYCAIETYKGFCVGATTAYLGLWALISLIRFFV